MCRWFEPEINNNFEFYFKKDDEWYKAIIYAGDWDFSYNKLGREKTGFAYSRYLKPNYKHGIIGKVFTVDDDDYYEDYFYTTDDHAEEVGGHQIIEFNTNEHGEVDLENVEFYDY